MDISLTQMKTTNSLLLFVGQQVRAAIFPLFIFFILGITEKYVIFSIPNRKVDPGRGDL